MVEYHEIADIIDERMPNGKVNKSISIDLFMKELNRKGIDV